MRTRILFAIVASVIVLGSGDAAAQEPQLPLGESKGVRIVRDDRGSQVWVFTRQADRLYQRVRGKRVYVSCTDLPEVHQLGGDEIGQGTQYERVPRRGRRLSTGDLTGWDFCRLFLPGRVVTRGQHRQPAPRRHLVSIPLTQAGAVQLDGERKVIRMTIVTSIVGAVADQRRQTTWPLFDDLPAKARTAFKIVSLAEPDDDPPPGSVGYFSDGQRHVAVSILSGTGVRLFTELEAGDVLHTNVTRYWQPWD